MQVRTTLLPLLVLCVTSATVSAQSPPAGHVSLVGAFFPNRGGTAELRARLFVEDELEPAPWLRITLSGFVEGLVARRRVAFPFAPGAGGDPEMRRAATARVQDANVEVRTARLDLLAGFARVAWGGLDELQPTDVVNPLDVSRFFFEGRSEARLPVALVRTRLFITGDAAIEAVYLPVYRSGRFDQLEEETSPFNVLPGGGVPGATDRTPDAGEAQAGVRFSATSGRVDWTVSAFRGFEPFGLYRAVPGSGIERTYPRFTMFGGDFETVVGEWGLRGEVAAFVEDTFQSSAFTTVGGSSFDAGVGVDRRAGHYRVSGTVLFHREQYETPRDPPFSGETSRNDVSFVASADRSFARERYHARVFAVYNASESSSFARGTATATLRDNLAFEASVGWFVGSGRDLVGRFDDSDFAYGRLKYYF